MRIVTKGSGISVMNGDLEYEETMAAQELMESARQP